MGIIHLDQPANGALREPETEGGGVGSIGGLYNRRMRLGRCGSSIYVQECKKARAFAVLLCAFVALAVLALLPSCWAEQGRDYYAILGLSRDASPREIKKAFKTLSVKYHPDKNPEGRDKFVEISNAYQVLSDPELKKRYDQYGENGLKNGAAGGGNFKFHDAFNVFEQFFGGRGGFTFNTGGAQFQFSSNMGGFGQQQQQQQQHRQQHRQQHQQQQRQAPPEQAPEEMYDNKGDVVLLDTSNFEQLVLRDVDAIWLVQFYNPECKHCRNIAAAYKEAAKKLRGMIKVGVVRASNEPGLAARYSAESVPALRLFGHGSDKSRPLAYDGPRHADAIAQWALKAMPSFATIISSLSSYRDFLEESAGRTAVILFSTRNTVPPMFAALSKDYHERLSFAVIPPEAPEDLISEFVTLVDVAQRPLVIVREPARVTPYPGSLTYLDLRRFLLKFAQATTAQTSGTSSDGQVAGAELTAHNVPELCGEATKSLCVIFFLEPHQLAGDYATPKTVMTDLSAKYANDRLTFLWLDRSRNPQFIEAMPVEEQTAKQLTLAVWNARKGKAITYAGSLDQSAVSSFLDSVVSGGKRWRALLHESPFEKPI